MKKLLTFGAMLLVLASCIPEEDYRIVDETPEAPSILYASIEKENDPETKVFLNEDRHTYWDVADEISVFYLKTGNNQYQFAGKEEAPEGTFEIKKAASGTKLSSNYVYAVSPYSSDNAIAQRTGVISVKLPAEQSYRAGSFGKGANTMVSVSEVGNDNQLTGDLSFKNVGGFICFRLYGDPGVKVNSITLTGNNGETLAGYAGIWVDKPGGEPSIIKWDDNVFSSSNSITLVCDPPVAVGTTKNDYTEFWMAVPPTEFTKGFTFTIRGGGNVTEKKVSAPVSVKRNYVTPIASVRVPYDHAKVFSVRSRKDMTLKEKIGQLFMVVDQTYVGSHITSMSNDLKNRYNEYPCGGFILKAENIQKSTSASSSLIAFTDALHSLRDYPLLSIDEEGGNVARIGGNKYFGEIYETNSSRQAGTVGATGNPANAYASGHYIGTYLRKHGLDVNLAPVADVNSNPDNPVINIRSFGSDAQLVADMVEQYLHGLQDAEVEGCLKHFPGHGDTDTDSHTGYAEVNKTWEEMLNCEIIPFKRGIDGTARMIMTAHITLPYVMPANMRYPSTLSYLILHDKLRVELGYTGVIITDSMGMGAITDKYSPSEAAIMAIQAGADIVLGPTSDYWKYKAICDEVYSKAQSDPNFLARIDESVDRILALKRHILAERGQLQ